MNLLKVTKNIAIGICLSGIYISAFPGKTTRVVLETITFTVIGFMIFNLSDFLKKLELKNKNLLYYFFYYSILVFIHGCFVSNSYEQWRLLVTSYLPILILPWVSLLVSIPKAFIQFSRIILLLATPLSFIFFAMDQMRTNENLLYVFYTSYVYFFIILVPYLKFRYSIIIITLSSISLLYNLDNRSNVIGIVFSLLLLFFFFFINKSTIYLQPILRWTRIFFFVIPIILSVLGFLGVLNVFQYLETNDAIIANSATDNEVNLATDSRSLIYQDAVESITSTNSFLFGNSPSSYYKTNLSDDSYTNKDGDYDKGRLNASEAAILNFLQWGGIIFVLLIFLLLYLSSYYAIFESKNLLMKVLGLFLSFRWLFLFIENPVALNSYWVMIFMVIGICLNTKFRMMSDNEMKLIIKEI